jgi:hypothetical protein
MLKRGGDDASPPGDNAQRLKSRHRCGCLNTYAHSNKT